MISKEEILQSHLDRTKCTKGTVLNKAILPILNAMEEYHQSKVKENELLHDVIKCDYIAVLVSVKDGSKIVSNYYRTTKDKVEEILKRDRPDHVYTLSRLESHVL